MMEFKKSTYNIKKEIMKISNLFAVKLVRTLITKKQICNRTHATKSKVFNLTELLFENNPAYHPMARGLFDWPSVKPPDHVQCWKLNYPQLTPILTYHRIRHCNILIVSPFCSFNPFHPGVALLIETSHLLTTIISYIYCYLPQFFFHFQNFSLFLTQRPVVYVCVQELPKTKDNEIQRK